MIKIGLISDTHSHLDAQILEAFKDCDEIWHAGDIGDPKVLDQLEAFKPTKSVYGNIDEAVLRHRIPEHLRFNCEGLEVWITHIGGYPGRYDKRVRSEIRSNPPNLFITGHSHILKVMPDKKLDLLHMNPGAAGHHGFHSVRTLLRFNIHEKKISQVEVIELGRRGAIL